MPQKTNSDVIKARLVKRRQSYKDMPRDKYVAMRAKENASSALRRKMETPEQREARLAPMRERARRRLASETPEQRQARLADQQRRKPAYRAANIERLKVKERSYYEKNRARIIANGKAYRKANPQVSSLRSKAKRASDPCYAMVGRLRCRLRSSLVVAGAAKAARTFDLVGCSQSDLVLWIERQFVCGMGWHNRLLWHIDHIIPLSAFDLTCEEQQRVAFHYTNLRPLWSLQNIRKGWKVPLTQLKLFWTLQDISAARIRLSARKT